ncbi:MAG: hypothetical protein ACE5GE_08380, partial [Phycisphaerae bacterium]
MASTWTTVMLGVVATAGWLASAGAQGVPDTKDAFDLRGESAKVIDRALSFLERTQQPDGGWQGMDNNSDPAITALVAQCFIQ